MHIPVLLNEAIDFLKPKKGEFFIDGTFGGGGHSKAILEKIGEGGKLLVIDLNEEAIANGKKELAKWKNIIFIHRNFSEIPEILKEKKLPGADGLILDLGFSSDQIENSGRGFSFNRDEPLLMTYSDNSKPVYEFLKSLGEKELREIISKFGEEIFAMQIAKAIKERIKSGKSIKTSFDLASVVGGAVPRNYERGRIHPATRTFQALRIYANKELESLEEVLKNLEFILKPGGRAVIISFHSLEDRLVKNYFRDLKNAGKLEILTKKPIMAGKEEVLNNLRSRSAKLRAIKYI